MSPRRRPWIYVLHPETWTTLKAPGIARRWLAQGGLCPICGLAMPDRFKPGNRFAPTLDHVFPRVPAEGDEGRARPAPLRGLYRSTVAAHYRCNTAKQSRWPTGCEMVWLMVVDAKLDDRRSRCAP